MYYFVPQTGQSAVSFLSCCRINPFWGLIFPLYLAGLTICITNRIADWAQTLVWWFSNHAVDASWGGYDQRLMTLSRAWDKVRRSEFLRMMG